MLPSKIDPEEALRRTADGSAVLIDVREQDEFDEARVAGARLIPLGDVAARVAEVPKDRDVIVMCRSGRRSGEAQKILLERGYQRVANLEGGIIAWDEAGLPLQR